MAESEEVKGLVVFDNINLHQDSSAIITLPLPSLPFHIGFDQVSDFNKIGRVHFREEGVYLIPIFYLPHINNDNIANKIMTLKDNKEMPMRYIFYDNNEVHLIDIMVTRTDAKRVLRSLHTATPEYVYSRFSHLEERINELSEKLKYLKE